MSKFKNTNRTRKAALTFLKKGYYTDALPGTKEYFGEDPESFEIVWSKNYNPTIHNSDGTVKPEYAGEKKLFGKFPTLSILANKKLLTLE